MEYTMQVLCCILFSVFITLNLGFFVRLVLDTINDRKDAKRKEAQRDEAVDFIMTFEEVASVLAGLDIQMEQAKPYSMSFTSVREAHGFAQAGGVMGAVKAYLKEEADKINAVQVANLDKKAIGALRAYAKSGKAPGQFIEVMACEGGCITGPCSDKKNIA